MLRVGWLIESFVKKRVLKPLPCMRLHVVTKNHIDSALDEHQIFAGLSFTGGGHLTATPEKQPKKTSDSDLSG